jgi:alpha-tubulin suppressor-like RCC1 family protein
MIDIDQLKSDLETYINNINSSSDVEEIMIVTLALNSLTKDRINSVPTVDDLPDLYAESNYLPDGSIFFVDSIKVLVFNSNFFWRGIDGRRLRYDGPPLLTALAWGINGFGRLGDGTTTSRTSPVNVLGGITNWKQLAAGVEHSLGVTYDGKAYAWGVNGQGRLGDGTTTSRTSPVTVVGGITNWVQVSAAVSGSTAAGHHSLGVTSSGIAYAWGYNGSGRLGDGTTTSRTSPVTVIGGITNWVQVAAGRYHSIGLTASGTAYAWGSGSYGALGTGNTTARSSPVTVIGGLNWSQVSAGGAHTLALFGTGIAYAWGNGGSGRLGDNNFTNRSSPVAVVGGITNWSQVSAGGYHSLGVTASGIAYAWGSNTLGQLGNGTGSGTFASPATVIGGITNWEQVSAGDLHSLGITDAGVLYAWGNNGGGIAGGMLGDGTVTNRSSPVTVVGGITNWAQMSAGRLHSLAGFNNMA